MAKISKTMGEQLVKALANPSYEMVGARTNTERAMIERGLVFHGRLREPVKDARGHQVRTHGLMLTDEGTAEAKRLAGEQQGAEVDETITREDVARGVEDALQWLHWGEREEARAKGAVAVLKREFWRSGKVWRKLAKQGGRVPVETQALEYYTRITKLLAAARRFEQEDAQTQGERKDVASMGRAIADAQQEHDAAQEAAQEGSKVEEQQEQAEERTGITRGFRVIEGERYPDRTPVLEVDAGHTYRLVAFAPGGVVEEAGRVKAYNVHVGLPNLIERYAVGTLNGERVAWQEDGHEWTQRGKYMIRTEDRGHGIAAVYVKGPAAEGESIDKAGDMYARRNLGASGGPVSSGVELADAGATWIAQRIYSTRPATPRQD